MSEATLLAGEGAGWIARVLNLYGGSTRDALFAVLRERLEFEKVIIPG